MKNKLAIIGGSGLYEIDEFETLREFNIQTPWGKTSDTIKKILCNNSEIYFLSRHGKGHIHSPSNINYKANIYALKKLGVTDILSISAVGSFKKNLPPKTFVIVDQFIDKTILRNNTFFDNNIVTHISMAHPTSNGLMNACEYALKKINVSYQRGGTYVVIEGPHFSTLSESKVYKSWNADVIGMTNMPEAKLAREAEIRYASLAMVTDYDCWHPDHENVTVLNVVNTFSENISKAKIVIKEIIDNYEKYIEKDDPACTCLDNAIMTDLKLLNKDDITKLDIILERVLKNKNLM